MRNSSPLAVRMWGQKGTKRNRSSKTSNCLDPLVCPRYCTQHSQMIRLILLITLVRRETNVDINCVKYTEEFDRVAAGFADGAVRLFQSSTMQLFTTLIDEEVKKANTPVTSIKHRPVSRQYPIENMITCSCKSFLKRTFSFINNTKNP